MLSVRELAAVLGVSTQLLYRHKEIPRFTVGLHIRFSERAVREYFAAQSLKH
jgi:excisionase family DNA binding protein